MPSPTDAGLNLTASVAWPTRWRSLRYRVEGFLNHDPSAPSHRVVGIAPGVQVDLGRGILTPYAFGGLGVYLRDTDSSSVRGDPGINGGIGVAWRDLPFFVALGVHHYGRNFGNGGVSPTLWSLSIGLRR